MSLYTNFKRSGLKRGLLCDVEDARETLNGIHLQEIFSKKLILRQHGNVLVQEILRPYCPVWN